MASSGEHETPGNGTATSIDPEPHNLLIYLPAYRVVVCSSCHYAIQPKAIGRHLKDIHNILRSRRRPFMRYILNLVLDDAEQVIASTIESFPVPLLPVQEGLKCESPGCQHLCVSEKRMRSHWLSAHDQAGRPLLDWQHAQLQTFFRGNLLRYFSKPESDFSSQPDGMNLPKESNCSSFLNISDQALLRHFITSTSLSIAHDQPSEALWQKTVPPLAYRHSFLMHGMLACSALHLSYKNPDQQQEYLIRGSFHQDLAMPQFRNAISNVDNDNCHSILVFSHLLVITSFALEREDERLLIAETNKTDVLPNWLYFLRHGCLMVCTVWDQIESGPVKELACQWEVTIEDPKNDELPLTSYLLSMIPARTSTDAWPEDVCRVYSNAAAELARAFSSIRILGEKFSTWDALRLWPMLISVEYMTLLSHCHPGALILLAHYCIILQKVERHWYFEGRPTKLLSTIMKHLDVKWFCNVRWPLEEIFNSSGSIA